ncbi:hypothetical protein HanIR_Chr01g0018541 [Helianthus annuus]|nr:hypothetical protein HanIR_Chr01g0018541 [Helianthus annuus]
MAIASWFRLQPFFAFGAQDLMQLHGSLKIIKNGKRIIQAIILLTCWTIWQV